MGRRVSPQRKTCRCHYAAGFGANLCAKNVGVITCRAGCVKACSVMRCRCGVEPSSCMRWAQLLHFHHALPLPSRHSCRSSVQERYQICSAYGMHGRTARYDGQLMRFQGPAVRLVQAISYWQAAGVVLVDLLDVGALSRAQQATPMPARTASSASDDETDPR
jgi:hypothetical protein